LNIKYPSLITSEKSPTQCIPLKNKLPLTVKSQNDLTTTQPFTANKHQYSLKTQLKYCVEPTLFHTFALVMPEQLNIYFKVEDL
jgi:hypothetical protein